MIPFKDLTLKDKETITKYTMNSRHRNCDLSFSNLCSWRFLYDTQFAEVDGFLVVKFRANKKFAYMMPIGEGDLKKVIVALEENAREEKEDFYMLGVTPDMKEEIEAAMPGRFTFTANRNYADYIYLRTDLANLTGKKYQSKRNHINKFKKNYPYEYVPLSPEHTQECLNLVAEWCKTNHCEEQEGMLNERRAIIYALIHFEELGLAGGLLRVNGKIVAFTFGMPISRDTFGIHVEKAHTDIDGAYATINYEFANHIPEQYTYINREEDLGIEGLRKAKLSYQPVIILEKLEGRREEEKERRREGEKELRREGEKERRREGEKEGKKEEEETISFSPSILPSSTPSLLSSSPQLLLSLKKLWKRCFHDSDEFVDMYFRLRYSSETTLYAQRENRIVSSLQMPYYAMTFEGTKIQTAYISGACTHPDFRGKGIMARLLAESFSRMAQKDIPLSILIPASPGLFDYYARTGYACAFFRSQIEQNISDMVAGKGDLHVEQATSLGQPLFDYFTEKAYSRPNYVQHTATDLEAVTEDLRMSGGSVAVARRAPQGPIAGLLFAYPEEGYLNIIECFADDDSVRDGLIRETARHYQRPKAVRYALPTCPADEQPFGMARIINAKMILSLYATAHPRERINIQLTDEQLDCNNGYYYIDNGACTFSPKAFKKEHLRLTAHELSAMIFSRTRLYMSLMLE